MIQGDTPGNPIHFWGFLRVQRCHGEVLLRPEPSAHQPVAAGPELQSTTRLDSSLRPRPTSPYVLCRQSNRVIFINLRAFWSGKPFLRGLRTQQQDGVSAAIRPLSRKREISNGGRRYSERLAKTWRVLSHPAWPVVKSCLCANL